MNLLNFYARKQNASRVLAIVWASVCPSVTLVICIKTVQARITKSSLWAALRSLVYRDKISCHWVQGFLSNEGVKEGYLSLTPTCTGLLESRASRLGLLKSTFHAQKFQTQVVLVYLQPFWRNSLLKCMSQRKIMQKNSLKPLFEGFKVVQGH